MCLNCESNNGQRTLGIVPNMPEVVPVEPSGECVDCGAEVKGAELTHNDDGDVYCGSCYGDKYAGCIACDCELKRDDIVWNAGGEGYCQSCYDDNYTTCDKCSDEVHVDDCKEAEGHRRYSTLCESCYDDIYKDCANCGCATLRDNMREGSDGDDYCEECFYESFRICDGCGETFSNDDVYYDERREGEYCSGCERSSECSARPFYASNATYTRLRSRRRYGVELETSKCDGYEDLDGRFCFSAEYDGSISGKEFVSAVLHGDQGLDAIAAFCDYAEEHNFKVDSSCGFHAHFDVSHDDAETLKRIAIAYLLTESVWTKFVSRSRRDNDYCGAIDWRYDDVANLDTIRDWKRFVDGRDRYCWLNVSSYYDSDGDKSHGTFEVRLHSASLNAEKVCNWVKAHTRFIDAVAGMTIDQIRAMFMGKTAQGIFDALSAIWGDAELSHFYRRRAELFGTTFTVRAELAAVA